MAEQRYSGKCRSDRIADSISAVPIIRDGVIKIRGERVPFGGREGKKSEDGGGKSPSVRLDVGQNKPGRVRAIRRLPG